jgi:hypothetical protein
LFQLSYHLHIHLFGVIPGCRIFRFSFFPSRYRGLPVKWLSIVEGLILFGRNWLKSN